MPTKAEIPLQDLPLNTPFAFEQDGMKIVLVRTPDQVFAFEDVCPHAFWPLSAGSFENGVLECPGHAWEFDVKTAKCRDSPGYCLTPVAVNLQGDTVHLEWDSADRDAATRLQDSPKQKTVTLSASNASQD